MRKNIVKLIYMSIFAGVFAFASCEADPALDPIQRASIKKASILGLKGVSYTNARATVGQPGYCKRCVGGVDTFNLLTVKDDTQLTLVSEFISENFSDLQSVDMYAVNNKVRTKIANVPASAFVETTGTNFRRATIKLPFKTLLASRNICDFIPSDTITGESSGIDVESDINLSDGTVVKSSQVVNTGLYNAAAFYPSSKIRFTATGPNPANKRDSISNGDSLRVDLLKYFPGSQSNIKGFTWSAEDNPAITGIIKSGGGDISANGNLLLSSKMTNTTTKRQSVIYTVTPILSNGCKGRPFLYTAAFRI
jgi:hypothetical protein